MALADYYRRAALAASQVISGFDEATFRETLAGTKVGVGIGSEAVGSEGGLALTDLVIRLLARLYPALEVRAASSAKHAADAATSLAQRINPQIESADRAEIGISIGEDAPSFPTSIFAGSAGWDALLSAQGPVSVGRSANPLGAGASACLAAAALFNQVFLQGRPANTQGIVHFSTFHREKAVTESGVPNDGWRLEDPGLLVGVGAIGNATAWALARSPMAGSLHLIDHQVIELSNLQRYVLAVRTDDEATKVQVTARYFDRGIEAIPHERTWSGFVQDFGYRWHNVLVALDSAEHRRAVQAALPEWIANAWTQPGDLGLSLHGPFGSSGACLCCLYLPSGQLPNEDELVAQAVGVPHLAADIRTLLYGGAGVSRHFLEAIASGLHLPVESLVPYEGRPLRELYVEGVCGGGIVPLGAIGSPRQEIHVPLAHQSALAGILLAAALGRRAIEGMDESSSITRIDILDQLGEYLTQPALNAADGRCICQDPDYVAVYREKYPPSTERARLKAAASSSTP
jgi:hypothetical protein